MVFGGVNQNGLKNGHGSTFLSVSIGGAACNRHPSGRGRNIVNFGPARPGMVSVASVVPHPYLIGAPMQPAWCALRKPRVWSDWTQTNAACSAKNSNPQRNQ